MRPEDRDPALLWDMLEAARRAMTFVGRMTRSMKAAKEDLELTGLWVVYPGSMAYRLAQDVWVVPLRDLGATWSYPT